MNTIGGWVKITKIKKKAFLAFRSKCKELKYINYAKKEGIETYLIPVKDSSNNSSNLKLIGGSVCSNVDLRKFKNVQNKEKRLRRTLSDGALERKTTTSPWRKIFDFRL